MSSILKCQELKEEHTQKKTSWLAHACECPQISTLHFSTSFERSDCFLVPRIIIQTAKQAANLWNKHLLLGSDVRTIARFSLAVFHPSTNWTERLSNSLQMPEGRQGFLAFFLFFCSRQCSTNNGLFKPEHFCFPYEPSQRDCNGVCLEHKNCDLQAPRLAFIPLATNMNCHFLTTPRVLSTSSGGCRSSREDIKVAGGGCLWSRKKSTECPVGDWRKV